MHPSVAGLDAILTLGVCVASTLICLRWLQSWLSAFKILVSFRVMTDPIGRVQLPLRTCFGQTPEFRVVATLCGACRHTSTRTREDRCHTSQPLDGLLTRHSLVAQGPYKHRTQAP